jgi:PmbA protein
MLYKSQIMQVFDGMMGGFSVRQGEFVLMEEDLNLTRFAESSIQQNISRYDRVMMVRAVEDKKAGVAVTNQLDTESILSAIKQAEEIAGSRKPDPNLPDMAESPKAREVRSSFDDSTAECSPGKRAGAAQKLASMAEERNLQISGAYETSAKTTAVANTMGTRQYFTETDAWLKLTVSGPGDISGWAQDYNRDVDDIDVGSVSETAITKAALSAKKIELPPGEYTVILEPAAVADMLLFLAFLGFGAKGMVTGRSFMARRMDEKIAGENITIIEDPFNPRISSMPFDYEGVPRKSVTLIENGIAKGVVSDRYYAAMLGTESTGHALPPNNNYGPYPRSMVMKGGDSSLEEMIASTEKGILITHWWYINFLNPMKTEITGTSQDGTLLIENGEIVSGVDDMRMGQSILEALSNVEALSSKQTLCPKFGSLLLVPAIKIRDFRFIG